MEAQATKVPAKAFTQPAEKKMGIKWSFVKNKLVPRLYCSGDLKSHPLVPQRAMPLYRANNF